MKTTKKLGQKYFNTISNFIKNELNGIKVESSSEDINTYQIMTQFGIYTVRVDLDQSYIFCIYGRFANVETAVNNFSCNPYTGKYNLFCIGNLNDAIIETKEFLTDIKYSELILK